MNKLTLTFLFALVAVSSAQDSLNPAAIFNSLLPENVCGPACGATCSALRAFCVSVPPLVDCDGILAQCQGLCNSACGCLTNCRSTCEEKNQCSGTGVQNLLCQGRLNTCVGLCQAACPVQTQFLVFQQAIQAAMQQFQGLIAAFQPQQP